MTTIASRVTETPREMARKRNLGLSGRLIALTITFVFLGEILVYLPMISSFRRSWLSDRVAGAQTIALVLSVYPDGVALPADVEARLLAGMKAQLIAIRGNGTRWLLTRGEVPTEFGATVDLRSVPWWGPLRGAVRSMFQTSPRPLRLIGDGMIGIPGVEYVEVILDEHQLREAMLAFTRRFLILSLFVCALTAILMFMALHRFIAGPVHRLTANIAGFADAPEDVTRIIRPSGRTDEIGIAERALARMQASLAGELRQKRHLAEIGLGVSKVNHELRNMLTTAQLLGDRLGEIEDPTVQRIAPRLIRTLNRAIEFCAATLAYGRAVERQPDPHRVLLLPLLEEMTDLVRLAPEAGIAIDMAVADDLTVRADPEQLSRILSNLIRNAVQALSSARTPRPRILISAAHRGDRAAIRIADNGPGIPASVRLHLFDAFQTFERSGGTGLGLAIAHELVGLQGGALELEQTQEGASFLITLPDDGRNRDGPRGGVAR